jgi:hypothetical protein
VPAAGLQPAQIDLGVVGELATPLGSSAGAELSL